MLLRFVLQAELLDGLAERVVGCSLVEELVELVGSRSASRSDGSACVGLPAAVRLEPIPSRPSNW